MKKCDMCVHFLKMKHLDCSRALCTYFDGRVYSDRNAKDCEGFKKPRYKRVKNVVQDGIRV